MKTCRRSMTSISDPPAGCCYLLDTNILSDLIRHPAGVVAQKIRELGEESVCTSIIVACELRFGAAKKNSPRLSARVEQLLASVDIVPLGVEADRHYGKLRALLERRGILIGSDDMLIAAHALAQGLTVVTDNAQEFSRVPGLNVENWLDSDS